MDQIDIFERFVDSVSELENSDLAKLADYALEPNWYLTQGGREATIDRVALKLYTEYFDSCAADEWGPSTFSAWYIDGALKHAA